MEKHEPSKREEAIGNPQLPYERLQSALETVESLIRDPDATCTLLGGRPDEAVLVATLDGYLGLARNLVAFVLAAKCKLGPLVDVEHHEFEGLREESYLSSCAVTHSFTAMGPYRHFVTPVCAYLAEVEKSRRELEAHFEKIGE